MSDGMAWSSAFDSFLDKLKFALAIGSITLLTIIVSVIIIVYLIRKANNIDPGGNARRILIHKIIAILIGITFIIFTHVLSSLPYKIYHEMPEKYNTLQPVINGLARVLNIIPVISIIACIYGPVAGFLVGFSGNIIGLIVTTRYDAVWSWLKNSYFFIPMGLYGLIIGFLWLKFTSVKNKIQINYLIIFCLLHIICEVIICNLISIIKYLPHFVNAMKGYVIIEYVIGAIITGVVLFINKNIYKNNIRHV